MVIFLVSLSIRGVHPLPGLDPPTGTDQPMTDLRVSTVCGGLWIPETNFGRLIGGFSTLKPASTDLIVKLT